MSSCPQSYSESRTATALGSGYGKRCITSRTTTSPSFYYPKGAWTTRCPVHEVRLAGPRSEGLKRRRIAPALLRCRLMYTCRGQQPAVLAVGLALLFELAFQGLDAARISDMSASLADLGRSVVWSVSGRGSDTHTTRLSPTRSDSTVFPPGALKYLSYLQWSLLPWV